MFARFYAGSFEVFKGLHLFVRNEDIEVADMEKIERHTLA